MKLSNIKGFLSIGLISVGMASCVVGKKYSQSNLEIPSNYRESIANVTGDTTHLPWKDFFSDPQLVRLIESALNKNNEIAVAFKNMEQQDLSIKLAKNNLMPTVDVTAGANRAWASQNSLSGSLNEQFFGTKYLDDYNVLMRVSWEIDIWGKTKMQKEAAIADYFAQKENLQALKTSIIVRVAQAYFNLIALDEQLKIAELNIALSDSSLKMMQLQYNAGLLNALAIQQAEAQKITAELLVPMALQNIAIQENALSILCGNYPNKIERGDQLKNLTANQNFSAEVPAQLLSRRPDLKAAELSVISLNAKTGLAKAAMYPSFSLTPQVGINSYKFNQWFDLPGSIAKTIAGNLAAPIFQKRQLKTAYQTAVIEQEKAVINFKQALMVAVGEVSNAMEKQKGAADRMQLIQQRAALHNKSIKDALMLYKSGMATYLEVITAQNNKLQNDIEYNNASLDKLNADVELYRALGGGVE